MPDSAFMLVDDLNLTQTTAKRSAFGLTESMVWHVRHGTLFFLRLRPVRGSSEAGGRATQGGGGLVAGAVEETSDPFAPRRVAVFAASGGGAAVVEPRQVAGIRARTARAIEARATRSEKKARLRKPQVRH